MGSLDTLLRPAGERLVQKLASSPYSTAFLLLALLCLTTRLVTGLQGNVKPGNSSQPRKPKILPYWIPWLGHSVQFGLRFQTFIAEARLRAKDDAFAIVLGGGTHNIVTQPSMTKEILNLRTQISNRDGVFYTMETLWDDHRTTRNMDQGVLWGPIHKALYQLAREPFLSKAIAATVKGVEEKTCDLVSFNPSWVDQGVWERSANISIIPGLEPTADVSLFPLIRDFVADIACTILMGRNFMDNNPNILQDLWAMDAKFIPFLLGIPKWFPGMTKASRARERLITAVAEHGEAVVAHLEGKDLGSKWDDMSDVSTVMVDRAKAYIEAGAPRRAYGAGNAVIMWLMNVNANQVIFWLLWHVYSQPELLEEIRKEIVPYVKIVQQVSDLPVSGAPRLSVDINGLMKECPLLNATFLETMRMDSLSSSLKKVMEDFTVTESKEDATIQGLTEQQTYCFKKDQMLWLPHAAHQIDARYWKEPERFDPKRFWVVDEKDPSKVSVDYGTMKVWGGGMTICKGRSFAEREVVAFCAGIFTMWDINALDGKWPHPGHGGGSGTAVLKEDVRVRMNRRS